MRGTKLVERARDAIGLAALLIAIASQGPGLTVARAESGAASGEFERFERFVGEASPAMPKRSSGQCSSGDRGIEHERKVEAAIAQLRLQAKLRAAVAAQGRDGDRYVVLNNRGYNY
jgi:hypothetical protein